MENFCNLSFKDTLGYLHSCMHAIALSYAAMDRKMSMAWRFVNVVNKSLKFL